MYDYSGLSFTIIPKTPILESDIIYKKQDLND